MNRPLRHETAKIYQFRPRSRAGFRGHGVDAQSVVTLDAPRIETVASCGSWYHEAAVQDAERTRKP